MMILARFMRNLFERFLGIFHEGPETPPRFADEVSLFRSLSPHEPTEEEWKAFAITLTDRAYRDGFVRGLYWLERSWTGPAISPEQLLEEEANQLRPRDVGEMGALLDRPLSAREVRDFNDAIGRARAAGIDVHLMPGRRES